MGNPTQEDFALLRNSFDGNDVFMRGCSTGGAARSGHAARVANIWLTDPWAFDDKQVRLLLLRAFPNLNTERETTTQRKRARRWMTIIQLYFRGDGWRPPYEAGAIAVHLNVETKQIEDTIRRIRKVAAGLRTTGKPRSKKSRGRPRTHIF